VISLASFVFNGFDLNTKDSKVCTKELKGSISVNNITMTIYLKLKIYLRLFLPVFIALSIVSIDISDIHGQSPEKLKIKFVDYFFENGSPILWSIQGDTLLKISLLPDYERESLNRQTTHWHFRVEADSGTQIRMSISKMLNEVYNGRPASEWWDKNHPITCYLSYDRKNWLPVQTQLYQQKELLVDFIIQKDYVYIARLPVYTISDLENLKNRYKNNQLFKVINIGSTIEKRPLEIIQLGNPDAKYSVILRARAHPWEPGGNWVAEGLINKFISENSKNWQETFCVYIMPMANKDGVARGMTRFNLAGMDLNRKWDKMSDPYLCPEKYALEKFIEELISKAIRPSLGIDIHNDDAGGINLATHRKDDTSFIKEMQFFEKLMREKTSFSEEVQYSWEDPGQSEPFVLFENGLFRRYGIEAIVYELNANWISSLGRMPTQLDWMNIGANLNEVFYEFLTRKAE
jgi:hypothetical protein